MRQLVGGECSCSFLYQEHSLRFTSRKLGILSDVGPLKDNLNLFFVQVINIRDILFFDKLRLI